MNDSTLIKLFGNSPTIRIIDFLIDNRPYDSSKIEISRESGVSRTAVFTNWSRLEKFGIVKVSRTFGNTKLYTLNAKNPIVKKLLDIDMGLMKEGSKVSENKLLSKISCARR